MRYIISDRNERELSVWPSDENPVDELGPHKDNWLEFRILDDGEQETFGAAYAKVLASEVYAFTDWLRTWANDARRSK
jgi:hypothetical protein